MVRVCTHCTWRSPFSISTFVTFSHQCLLVRPQKDVKSLSVTQLPIAQLGKILEALFQDEIVLNRAFPQRTAPSLMRTLSMQREAPSLRTASWKVIYIRMSLYIPCTYVFLPCNGGIVYLLAHIPYLCHAAQAMCV